MISNLLLVAMFLCFTVPSIIFHQYLLAMSFSVYGATFGFLEFVAKTYTGKTVSQHIISLVTFNRSQGNTLLWLMGSSWICYILHFFFSGIISTVLYGMFFIGLIATSLYYKEYFLTLAGIIFVFSVSFVDSISLLQSGVSTSIQMHSFILAHPFKGLITMLSALLGWRCLLVHLGVKIKK